MDSIMKDTWNSISFTLSRDLSVFTVIDPIKFWNNDGPCIEAGGGDEDGAGWGVLGGGIMVRILPL